MFGASSELDSVMEFGYKFVVADRRTYGGQQSKVPICIALYHEQLTSKALRYGTC